MGMYRIEVRYGGQWIPAPGDASGWELERARVAVEGGILGMDGEPYAPEDVRIVAEDGILTFDGEQTTLTRPDGTTVELQGECWIEAGEMPEENYGVEIVDESTWTTIGEGE